MSVNYNSSIVTSGLVLALDAANPRSYPGSGTTWTDISATGNNGTLQASPTYTSGISGYFNFTAASLQYVSFANTASFQFLNRSAYSLEAWVYPTSNPGINNWTGIFNREDSSTGSRDGYNLYFLGSASTSTFFTTERFVAGVGISVSVTVDSTVSLNVWQHIVATYDGTTISLYRNGASVGTPVTSTGNITNTSKTLEIANRSGNYFTGRISNTKVYNVALSSSQVLQNFNALRGRYGI